MSWVESFAAQLTGGGVTGLAAFGVAYLGGLVAGFGPCVLPMVPAVFGYVTGHVADAEVSGSAAWRRGFALSATFVLGMALLFAAIEPTAALVAYVARADSSTPYILSAHI